MLKYIAKNVIASIVNISVIISIVFILMNILPSDPARVRLGVRYNERDAQIIRQQYGLDKPLIEQFGTYLLNMAKGDFGVSIMTGETISTGIQKRFSRSFLLIFLSLLFSLPMMIWGVRGAIYDSKLYKITEEAFFSMSVIPVFVFGVVAVFTASKAMHLSLIPSGQGLEALPYYIIPALLLSVYPSFILFKIVQDTLKDTLKNPYIVTLRAYGFSDGKIIFPYALRNCAVSILGVLTNLSAYYLTSIYLIEFIFSLGGIGSWAVTSARNYDIPVVLATVVITAIIYNVVNIISRILAPFFDKRLVLV